MGGRERDFLVTVVPMTVAAAAATTAAKTADTVRESGDARRWVGGEEVEKHDATKGGEVEEEVADKN
jgi:hypothetical protein